MNMFPTRAEFYVPLTGLICLIFASVIVTDMVDCMRVHWGSMDVPLIPHILLASVLGVLMTAFPVDRLKRVQRTWYLQKKPYFIGICGIIGAQCAFLGASMPQYAGSLLIVASFCSGCLFVLLLVGFLQNIAIWQGVCLGFAYCAGNSLAWMTLLTLNMLSAPAACYYALLGLLLFVAGCLATRTAFILCGFLGPVRAAPSQSSHALEKVRIKGVREVRQMEKLLCLLAIFFFVLHGLHGCAIKLSVSCANPPSWLILLLGPFYVAAGFLADIKGTYRLGLVALALSVLAAGQGLFGDSHILYWALYSVDIVGMHCGLFFLILAFYYCSTFEQAPALMLSMPYMVARGAGALTGFFAALFPLEPLNILLISLACCAFCNLLLARLQTLFWGAGAMVLDSADGTNMESPEDITASDVLQQHLLELAGSCALSPRELEVLVLICKGMSCTLMSRKLNIAESTVKIHVSRVLKKTGVSSRHQLMGLLIHRTYSQ